VVNLDRFHCIMKFITTNLPNSALCTGYKENHIAKMVNTNFLVTYRLLTVVINK